MLPRSDKFYVGVIIVFSSLVIIASIIAAIAAFSGDTKPNPEYESAPDPSLVQPPPDTLLTNSSSDKVVLSEISSPPINDSVFLLIHKTTRSILESFAKKNFREEIARLGLGYETTKAIETQQLARRKDLQAISSVSAVPGSQQIDLGSMELLNYPSLDLQPGQKKLRIKVTGNEEFRGAIGDAGVDVTTKGILKIEMRWELLLAFDKSTSSWNPVGGWHVVPGDTTITPPSLIPNNNDLGS